MTRCRQRYQTADRIPALRCQATSTLRRHWLGWSIPKLRPTMQCHVALYFLSNSFLMKAAMSFSMLYRSRACEQQKTSQHIDVNTPRTVACVPCCTRTDFRNGNKHLRCAVDGICLHVLRHVGILNDSLPLRHGANILWRPWNRKHQR